MAWFQRLSVWTKLLLSFVAVSIITCIVGVVGLTRMATINDMLVDMYQQELRGTAAAMDANFRIASIGRDVRELCLADDKAVYDEFSKSMDEHYEGLKAAMKTVDETTFTEEGRVLVQRANDALPKYWALVSQARDLAVKGQNKEGFAKIQESAEFGKELRAATSENVERKLKRSEASAKTGEEIYASARLVMIAVIAGGILVSIMLGVLIARWFTKAITQVDEIATSVASASQQLAAASEQLSSGAQQSASSLEETASSLEEMTATVRQNADNAVQANQLANSSRETAEKGGAVVANAVRAMGEINQASRKIADIITTIDEIAFQTNLLALNAAVEAARAGEQGRGFAVVAGEVRNLAQRSATAAKEIKGLIEDSVSKVETGSQLVNQSGETLDAIVTSVKRVTDIVGEIAAASREQSAGIDQINKAVAQMDQVTQANASQTEEMSGTAVSLSSQAEQLQAVVAQFNLKKNEAGPSTTTSKLAGSQRKSHKTVSRSVAPSRPAKTNSKHELELVGAGAGSHDGFEEF